MPFYDIPLIVPSFILKSRQKAAGRLASYICISRKEQNDYFLLACLYVLCEMPAADTAGIAPFFCGVNFFVITVEQRYPGKQGKVDKRCGVHVGDKVRQISNISKSSRVWG